MNSHGSGDASRPASLQFNIDRLDEAIAHAKQLGFQIRRDWLGGAADGWCEIAGRRILFVDLSLSIDEQLEQVTEAIAAVRQHDKAA